LEEKERIWGGKADRKEEERKMVDCEEGREEKKKKGKLAHENFNCPLSREKNIRRSEGGRWDWIQGGSGTFPFNKNYICIFKRGRETEKLQ